jgi:PAS domain S-box-containing protein
MTPLPRFGRRALERGRRSRGDAGAALPARLIDLTDLSLLLREVNRGARSLSAARSAELALWRTPTSGPRATPQLGRRLRPQLEFDRVLRRVHAGQSTVTRHGRAITMLLPLQHAGRSLGCVQLGWRRPPDPARLAALRRYLAHAGAAVARSVAEERLLRQHRRYEALLDSLPDACLLVLSRGGTVLGVRGHAAELVGVTPESLLGQPLVGPDGKRSLLRLSRTRLRQLLAGARRHGKAECETRLRGASREIQVQMTLVDLNSNGEMVCVLRDLTEVKAMELALLRRNEELTQAAERLKEIDVLKNEFLSNVSHELRTPLTAIIAYSEALLLTPPEPETQKDFLRVIAEQGHKLQRLITGLLDIAKLESLATELKLQRASLNDVVQSAVVTVRPLADKNRIRVALVLQPDLPEAYLDELRSQQIVWNLLTNAVKFSPPESVVEVRTWSADGQVWASVRDQGIGIAPEHQELIFEKFVQVDGSSTRRQGGVGLGLDLVKHLVELHGGQVRVESAPGEGACFTFSIPIEKRSRPRLADLPRRAGSMRARS